MKMKYVMPLLFAAVVGLSACNNDDDDQVGTAKMQVRLTDAPGDYEEVNVDIRSVEIHKDANDNGTGWQTLSNIKPGVYNLLDFANGKDTLLASAELPAGHISQIRLVLGPNNSLKLNDGTVVPLNTPSGQQSGLKVQIHQELKADVTYVILLDFDASRSVVKAGNSGNYNLKPVIRAITTAVAGGIRGEVTPVAADPDILVISAANDTVGAVTDASGRFMVKGLTGGTYKVMFDGAGTYKDTTYNVNVTTDQITDMGMVDLN
ncbi:MAG: DUF4382 domain-containing protein [Hymenobacteraceae bacterium]|nr:DUF4382 domain-containing protein [Hymenobacteraceae bacterium]MDX5397103.1 DUF4382 domain-containing protein [Hymenobacteraceae bacterium]MDX5442417.1 DUF4382 domain-containing protein [Hymenobacteraceae bacterium]MDX5513181.1 DUF4382 domain-containing protein [Hymenobacteraceae bacterium]